MTETNTLSRQPTKLDYASPNQFKFNITKLPKVEYFCTSVNVPGISLYTTQQQTPLKDIPLPGEKLTYGNLVMTFLVDEDLENFREIHGWLTGVGFPQDRKQFRDILGSGSDRFPTSSGSNLKTDPGKTTYSAVGTGAIYSDATLNILTSKNNANIEVRFSDVFPISLTGLQYNVNATDIQYLEATVEFGYKIYEFATKGASRTTTTIT